MTPSKVFRKEYRHAKQKKFRKVLPGRDHRFILTVRNLLIQTDRMQNKIGGLKKSYKCSEKTRKRKITNSFRK